METNKIADRELLESQQIPVDEARRKMIAGLSEEEQAQHAAVEAALDLLAKHKIMAFIYADVRDVRYPVGITCVHQYNTIGNLSEYDEDGNHTESFTEKLVNFNSGMWYSLFTTVVTQGSTALRYGIDKLKWHNKDEFSKVMGFFESFVVHCLNTHIALSEKVQNEARQVGDID